jgi:rubredoxin
MTEKFSSEEQLHEYLQFYDLDGLDSEFSKTSKALVEAFSAKGMDLNRWWVCTDVGWVCPCCKRRKPEIVRLNQHGYLTGHLHEHHDHMEDFVAREFTRISEGKKVVVADLLAKRFVIRTAFAFSAYDSTVICADCNMADSKAKKAVGAPKEFSFSPDEISSFIRAAPNKEHDIDSDKALETWTVCREMFFIRRELVLRVATLAADNEHWYQPSIMTAKNTERAAQYRLAAYGLKDIDFLNPEKLLHSPNKFSGSADSWRRATPARSTIKPNDGELQHLIKMSEHWSKVLDDWHCAICKRPKLQTIRKSNKGKWSFVVSTAKVFHLEVMADPAADMVICNDCSNTATLIGKEVESISNLTVGIASSIVAPGELAKILHPFPHSKHWINNEEFEKLLPILLNRALSKTSLCTTSDFSE